MGQTGALDPRTNAGQFLLELFVAAIQMVDAIHNRFALGHQANHQTGRGTQVGRHHGGARQAAPTPCTMAVLPSTSILAPSRMISCTCMKRFSKIVSVDARAVGDGIERQ